MMGKYIGRFVHDARGATAIEYGLVVALVVIAILTGVATLGGSTGGMWHDFTAKIVAAES